MQRHGKHNSIIFRLTASGLLGFTGFKLLDFSTATAKKFPRYDPPGTKGRQALQLQMAPPVPNMFLSKIKRLMYLAELDFEYLELSFSAMTPPRYIVVRSKN